MEHPTHCIGSACVLPDGCRFLRKHSEIIAQKWRAEPLLRQPAPSRSRKTSESTRLIGREGGGVRQGAVWNSLRHETGRCLGLVASRNRALPETRHATERGAEVQRRTLATARRRALAERWEVRRVEGVGECWGGHPCARAKFIRGWQDLCAMHDLRAPDDENAPWWQDVRAAYSPAALCGAFWIHGTHILPELAAFECMQAICCHELAFFSSRPLRERIRTISCHGRQLGNASRRYIAVARPGGCTAHVANGAESAGRVKAELQAGAELRTG